MEFRTIIDIPHAMKELSIDDSILFLGSCFSEHIYNRCLAYGIAARSNPFGTLYNPLSIAKCLQTVQVPDSIVIPEVQHDGCYHSFLHHSRFSSPDKATFEQNIAESIRTAKEALSTANTLIITFGTAWVFEHNHEVVSNCHKLPAKAFTRRRLSVEEIVSTWVELLQTPALRDKRVLFTVSPIRHKGDGLHENNISKATLLLAIEELQQRDDLHIEYFPSYEIVLDELRDYRFFAPDMMHPSQTAVDYVWERFTETYFSAAQREEMKQRHKVYLQEQHRPNITK